MSKDIELAERYEQMDKVIRRHLAGENPTAIARATGIKRVDVLAYLDEWRDIAVNNPAIRERAKETLLGFDAHTQMLIKKAYEVIEEVDAAIASGGANAQMLAQKNQAIKITQDLELKRLDSYQKAGLLEDNETAEAILETERKQEAIVNAIREVSLHCPNCRTEIAKRLTAITGEVQEVSESV